MTCELRGILLRIIYAMLPSLFTGYFEVKKIITHDIKL